LLKGLKGMTAFLTFVFVIRHYIHLFILSFRLPFTVYRLPFTVYRLPCTGTVSG
jgi:hypothetical protein